MSVLVLHDQSNSSPDKIKISLVRADRLDTMHCVPVARELKKVIANDAKEHGVEYDDSNFRKVVAAYKRHKLQAYFLVVEDENCGLINGVPTPLYAGGAIQFETAIAEWNGRGFDFFPAVYSEDTWVDRGISDAVRQRTGVGLGTLNSQGRIILSAAGHDEDLPFGMVSRARISENALDNQRQLAILSKLGANIDLKGNAVTEFDGALLVKPREEVKIKTYAFVAQNAKNGSTSVVPNVFLTLWSNGDGTQQIAGIHTEAISTVTGETIIRSQFTDSGNVPPPAKLQNIMAAMIAAGREEVKLRKWGTENGVITTSSPPPTMRAHAYGKEMVTALRAIGGEPRYFGFNRHGEPHLMVAVAVNNTRIPDIKLRERLPAATQLMVIERSQTSTYADGLIRGTTLPQAML
jgi:hypothetical protein